MKRCRLVEQQIKNEEVDQDKESTKMLYVNSQFMDNWLTANHMVSKKLEE